MTVQNIMRIVPSMQSIALAGENIRLIKKKKIKTKDIVSTGMKNIIGVEFIRLQSQFYGSI